MKNPEILAPGGSFNAAYHALEWGADGVYTGLPRFSARKAAHNLSLEELRRLKGYAREKGKKVYLAMNTLVKEEELDDLLDQLQSAAVTGVDGIIVQDFGLLEILRRGHWGLKIHASTQMGIHNKKGVEFLLEKGVRRAVLSRELTLEEIREIKEAFPEMELEVFIHGALCYGFSGLCLISGLLLDRSGNRGECAQICRSWFSRGKEKGYYFSTSDLALKERVISLKEAGVDSFKIEGRMKAPEYAAYTAAYYRSVLEGKGDEALYRAGALRFARKHTRGFVEGEDKLINAQYPGHMGLPLGTILEVRGRRFLLRPVLSLGLREGLLFLRSPGEVVKTGIAGLFAGSRRVFQVSPGQEVWVETDQSPPAGAVVYKISEREGTLPVVKPGSLPLFKQTLECRVRLTGQEALFHVAPSPLAVQEARFSFPFTPLEAREKKPFFPLFRDLLSRGGDGEVFFDLREMENRTGLGDDEIFVPPGVLKELKNSLYRGWEQWLLKKTRESMKELKSSLLPGGHYPAVTPPRREDWVFRGVPFAGEFHSPGDFPLWEGYRVIPLPPLDFGDRLYGEVKAFLEAHCEERFLLGINNPAHLVWVREWDQPFFVDYCLYVANRGSLSFFLDQGALFLFSWLEGGEKVFHSLAARCPGTPLFLPGREFKPHLFLSRVCFRKHSLGKSCAGCSREGEWSLIQNNREYKVVVRNCLTYLFG